MINSLKYQLGLQLNKKSFLGLKIIDWRDPNIFLFSKSIGVLYENLGFP